MKTQCSQKKKKIFSKNKNKTKNNLMGESLFNKYFWENWISTCKRMKIEPPTSHHIHIKLDHRPKCKRNCKTLRLKHRSKSSWTWVRQWFIRYSAQATKEIDKLDFIEIKNFMLQITFQKVKRQPTEWEKIQAIHISDKGLVFRT